MDNFSEWNEVKIKTNNKKSTIRIREGEVRWCRVGKNIGSEVQGKGDEFIRPILVLKKFTGDSFLGVPLTSKIFTGSWYYIVNQKGVDRSLILNQARLFDRKRLQEKMFEVSEKELLKIKQKFCELILSRNPKAHLSAGLKWVTPNYVSIISATITMSKDYIDVVYCNPMYDLNPFKQEVKQAQEWLAKEYSQIHTGRAAPALLDGVLVESYGMTQPLKNVASVTIEDPKTLRVAPWDKGQIKDVERGLYAADLNFSIAVDDAGVRVIIPALTTETRQKLAKIAKERLEDARITVRKAREAALNDFKNQKFPEDVLRNAKEDVQALVDAANSDLEALYDKKETEILN